MEQTYGFFGFIVYLLGFLGCNGGNNNNPPPIIEAETAIIETTETPQYEVDYYNSLNQWNQEKKTHNNSYEYTLFFENSEHTYNSSTIVVVKNGTIQSREKKAYSTDPQTGKVEPIRRQTWTENKEQLGTHDESPKTLDELYEDCNTSLSVDPNSNDILFTTDNNQLMSICGHNSKDCSEGCFEGLVIEKFKWLD
jgi:hypothetical protein